MSVQDMQGGGFDPDEARYERMNRTQQAQFAPGQGSDDPFGGGDIFANSTMPNNPGAMGDIFSTGVGSTGQGGDIFSQPMGTPSANSMTGQPQQAVQKDASDVFWDVTIKAGKGTFGGLKAFFTDLSGSFGLLTPLWWYKYAFKGGITSFSVAITGVVLRIFGLGWGLKVAIGALLSLAFYVVLFFIKYESSRGYTSLYKDSDKESVSTPGMSGGMGDMILDADDDPMGFSNPSGGFEVSSEGYEEEEDPYSEYEEEEEEDIWGDEFNSDPEPVKGMSADEALNSLPDVPKGMYERRYLYDMFSKVLPTMKPHFSEMKTYDEDDDEFLLWGDRLIEASMCAGCKEDYTPELVELQENLFVVVVTCTRPQGCKPEAIGMELANIYAYDESTGERNGNIFAKTDTVGSTIKITLFNGASCMVALKDMMLVDEVFILDNKNYIPVIIGINQLGKVIHVDLKKLESIIVTGMPRSGKSWLVQSILTQMCVYVPPSELHIYICDPKEGISDFKGFVLPHVKKFVSDDDKIVITLRDLVKVEAPRRKKIIGDAGFVNIWDFKEKHPDVKLPIIYVVVDEVVTLASRMDKETNNEFRMLLRELISQLPALGIRAFLIPHILNNEIIEKKTSDLVPCKISVCGDEDHIFKATGSKFRDFPYRLVNKGDLAVKLVGHQNTLFVHGAALTESNPGNNDLFDYLRRVWNKLEPEETANSRADGVDETKELEDMTQKIMDMEFSDEDIGLL